jgi:hypothetical protein
MKKFIFGTKLEDLLNYRIDSISQTVEKVVKKIFLARRKRPKLEIVRCWLSRQWRYSGGRSTYYYFGALKIFFSQLFRRFGILNCNLSDSLKNLPTLFQKWFEYFNEGINWPLWHRSVKNLSSNGWFNYSNNGINYQTLFD